MQQPHFSEHVARAQEHRVGSIVHIRERPTTARLVRAPVPLWGVEVRAAAPNTKLVVLKLVHHEGAVGLGNLL